MKSTLIFFVNGKKVVDAHVDPELTLLQYLRLKLRLCGTKLGCGEGGCGACTVMISRFDRITDTTQHLAVNACLTPICAVHGQAVTTTEGIGSTKTRLHPVQERIYKSHGSQCGFCTPGIVMSMYALLRNSSQPTMEEIETCFQGNLCRCTGYRPILEGFKTFTKEKCCGGKKCCQMKETNMSPEFSNEFIPYDPSQEPIFPPELKLNEEYDKEDVYFESKRVKWIRPSNLETLLNLKSQYPNAKLVVGNSEIGVEVKFKKCYYPVIIAATNVPELFQIEKTETGITVGVSNTLSTLQNILQKAITDEHSYKTRTFVALVETLQRFAGKQIRNVASIAGNIMTASPISDLNPIFMATNCILKVASKESSKTITIDGNFFTGYRKTLINFEEVIISIHIPFTRKDEYVSAFKQARRYDDDIAIVNCGMRVLFKPKSNVIQEISLAYGGMAPTTVMAKETMQSLKNRYWDEALVADACKLLGLDLPLDPSAPGSMVEFRCSLTTSFFFKFYLTVSHQLELEGVLTKTLLNHDISAIDKPHRGVIKSTQIYQVASPGKLNGDSVGQPIAHLSAAKQATGEAVYCDDIPHFENELYLAIVTSTRAHAKIVQIDPSEALLMDGVEAFFCHRDIATKNNIIGPVFKDEEMFASKTVTCQGQLIGAIIAVDQATAQRAAVEVKVEYEDIEPIILTIEDAIDHGAFNRQFDKSVCRGDLVNGFALAEQKLEGEIRMGGQEHFYLETNCAIAVPKGEDGEIEIITSSQNPSEIQNEVAHVLGVQSNRVVCKVKRLGGGFGGKETRAHIVALPCAFAAHRLNRPVRCMLDRDEDMTVSGTRHPFLGKYKVGFMNDGQIQALDATFFSNRGNSMDLSLAVMERAVFSADNAYYIPSMRGRGSLCATNIPSNTAFRGFGAPQGMMLAESVMHDMATFLKMDPAKIREINLYQEGDSTHFSQKLINCTIRQCWQECLLMSDYWNRRLQIESFNKEHRWKKRGLAIIPTKFSISFTVKSMNQGGALIHIYRDGSVLLTHGGTEMGQGLHTKMVQVASRALEIPFSKIHISETSTDKIPNTSPTAASASSDINGMAILDACNTIKNRLQPIIAADPNGTWENWINTAYLERISLSSTGFYKTPGLNYDSKTNSGNPFSYFTYGVGCSEVEIDCLTGDHRVLRTDIVMDVGQSLNPAIDVGQIEGAFIQGYGLFVMEELRHSPNGILYTRGPGMYKIPSFIDIPAEFNVALLKGVENPRAVYSSKAIGEPPLFLAASVFFAIKDAIQQARQEEGIEGIFELQSPATAERIRLACMDQFTQQFPSAPTGTFKPWSVVC